MEDVTKRPRFTAVVYGGDDFTVDKDGIWHPSESSKPSEPSALVALYTKADLDHFKARYDIREPRGQIHGLSDLADGRKVAFVKGHQIFFGAGPSVFR